MQGSPDSQAATLNDRHLVSVTHRQRLRHREQLAMSGHVPSATEAAWLPEEVLREMALQEHEAWLEGLRERWGL